MPIAKTFCLPFLLISCSISQLQEETKSFADFMFEAEDWTASEVGQLHGGLLLQPAYCALASVICGDSGLDTRPCAHEARASPLAVA